MWRVAAVLAALLPWGAPLPAQAAGRVALVVGNGAYTHIGRLPNPTNDAADVGAALRRLGFEVTQVRDADLSALTTELRAFSRRSRGADVALVFYAGHGMEMDGVNYLLPVDARLERDTDVWSETVTLDNVLVSTSGAGLRLVILDACRNNPLARSMERTSRTRNVSNGSLGDLNEDLLVDETLVAYSAEAGRTADDGEGRNSPYTAALLAHLEKPMDVGIMFRYVRARVRTATNRRQIPHVYSSLEREHYLSGAGGSPDPVFVQQETAYWRSVENSTNPADLEEYLRRWPDGAFVRPARTRLAALRAPDPPRPGRPAPTRPDPASARPRAGEVFRDCNACPEMVVIPAGTFRMGASEEDRYVNEMRAHQTGVSFWSSSDGPQHRVTLRSFALGATEVTFDEWDACVRGGGCNGYRPRDEGWGRGARPVSNMSWEDARAYVRWLSRETGESYRLPSESEWEYAARAGTTTPFHTGTMISKDQANYGLAGWGWGRTTPVRTFAPNPFGLYDVLGNVWEWTEDCWNGSYRGGAPADGSPWGVGDCSRRVLRGTWVINPRDLHSAARSGSPTGLRVVIAGFRVARTLD